MGDFLAPEQERDFLLSTIISLEALAKGGNLTSINVLAITQHVLARIKPTKPNGDRQ